MEPFSLYHILSHKSGITKNRHPSVERINKITKTAINNYQSPNNSRIIEFPNKNQYQLENLVSLPIILPHRTDSLT